MKRTLISISKVAVGVGVLALVFSHVDAKAIWGYIRQIQPHLLILALLFASAGQVAGAMRMQFILRESGLPLSYGFSTKLAYVGGFFNILLPGGVGGDAIKIYFLRKKSEFGVLHLVRLLVADRASGLFFLCFMAFVMILMVRPFNAWAWLEPVTWIGFAFTTGVYLLANSILLHVPMRTCLKAIPYSLAVQSCWVATVITLWAGIGGTTHMVEYVLLYAVASIASTVPLSVGGLGLREMAFLYGAKFLRDHAGLEVNAELGVALSLALYAMMVLSVLPGILFWKQVKEHKGLGADSASPEHPFISPG